MKIIIQTVPCGFITTSIPTLSTFAFERC